MQLITPSRDVACPRLWRDFPAADCVRATLEITGLGLYRAFLNGERIGRDYLTPGFNDYDACLRTQTYDVTAMLRAENRLEVWLGNGWYRGRIGFDGGQTCLWGDRYLLAARLTMTGADGRQTVLETDEACWPPGAPLWTAISMTARYRMIPCPWASLSPAFRQMCPSRWNPSSLPASVRWRS